MKHGTSHKQQLDRLNRIEGQVRGIGKMIDERRYCLDIITQLKAVRAALKRVEAQVVEEHMNHCVKEALSSADKTKRQESLQEIMELLKKSGS